MKTTTATTMKKKNATTVNRIPPSTKRRHSASTNNSRHSSGSSEHSAAAPPHRSSKRNKSKPEPMDLEEVFAKLDSTDPVQGRRLQQRRKDISKGKNTVGYTEYLKLVPRDKRRLRSMDTPVTPDPALDISNKRWQGRLRAWYVSSARFRPCCWEIHMHSHRFRVLIHT